MPSTRVPRVSSSASRSAAGRSRLIDRRSIVSLLIQSGIWLAMLVGGGACVVEHFREPAGVLGYAGIGLLACAAIQARVGMTIWRKHLAAPAPWTSARGVAALAAGGFLAFLGALAIGPRPGMAWAWWAAVASCYTAIVCFAATSQSRAFWRRFIDRPRWRTAGRVTGAAILLMIASEAALEAYKQLGAGQSTDEVVASTLTAAADEGSSGEYRVVVIGDRRAIAPPSSDGCLAHVEEMLPGWRMAPWGLSDPWSSERRDWAEQLTAAKADLALVLIDVCDDLAVEPAPRQWFDWRQWELPSRMFGVRHPAPVLTQIAKADNYESFLRRVAPQLAVCRTPINPAMQARWSQTFRAFEALSAACRQRNVPLALVLVPGPVQLNRGLSDTLARRAGGTAEQYDLELPQRRWMQFAEVQSVPTLDLLPHLRLCRQTPYVSNGTTWNDQGNAAAATAVGNWLQSQYGQQEKLAASLRHAP